MGRYGAGVVGSEEHASDGQLGLGTRGLTVPNPKTEHHAGHEQRLVPITPKLITLLQDRVYLCADSKEHLVAIRGQGRIMRQVLAIVGRAGVELWARLWQTLRVSCEREWAMTLPQYAVSKWIGHRITASGRHYPNGVRENSLIERRKWRVAKRSEVRS